mmetsp:Transcript_3386/g.11945  ORF Transcript_3386/g.11945 Transcript_3386/m.11945 type:complete len:343 (-) Transcript_3386:9-1037(-)
MSIALVRLRISPLRKRAPGLLVFVEISRLERHGAPRSRNVGVASRASVGKRAWDRPRARVADIPCAEALGASRQGAEACPSGAVPSRPPAGAVSPGAGDDGSRAEALGTLALPHVGLRLAVLRPRVALLLLLEAGLALGREAALAEGQEQGQRELVVAPAAGSLGFLLLRRRTPRLGLCPDPLLLLLETKVRAVEAGGGPHKVFVALPRARHGGRPPDRARGAGDMVAPRRGESPRKTRLHNYTLGAPPHLLHALHHGDERNSCPSLSDHNASTRARPKGLNACRWTPSLPSLSLSLSLARAVPSPWPEARSPSRALSIFVSLSRQRHLQPVILAALQSGRA